MPVRAQANLDQSDLASVEETPACVNNVMNNDTVLIIECMYCHKKMGEKPGKGSTGTTSSICRECWAIYFPDKPYPEDEDGDLHERV